MWHAWSKHGTYEQNHTAALITVSLTDFTCETIDMGPVHCAVLQLLQVLILPIY